MTSPTPKAPKTLSPEARGWWRRLAAEYDVGDQAGLLLLQTALEAFGRMRGAEQRIKADGLVLTGRDGQVKNHPLLTVERDTRSQMLMALKALNLDLEPLRDRPGRPPGR